MKIILTAAFLLSILCMGMNVSAQIVNVESARMQSDTVGWMGGGGLGLSLSKNREEVFGTEAEAHLQYKTSRDRGLWLILANYNFLKAGDQRFVSNEFGHLRYNRKLNEWLRWEIFTQFQNNIITQIDSRFLIGTGPRFKLVKTKILRLYAASLVMFEAEKERTNPEIKHRDIRSSSYVSFTFTPHEHFEIISTTFYQPLLRKFSDFRILNQLTLKSKMSKHFALSIKWNYLHDRFPAGVAPRTTYNLSAGVDFEL